MKTLETIVTGLLIPIVASVMGADEPRVSRDASYVEPPDSARRLDVYAPSSGDGHPIVVWIHGGGWRRGDKAAVQEKPAAFVERGYVFVSINYRFVPEVTVREIAGDVARAIRWTRDHAEEFGGDSREIFVMGHSAGAHLAALVCTDTTYLSAQSMRLADIRGCVPVDTAVYDIRRQIAATGPNQRGAYEVFGDESTQQALSPATHVAADRGIPPFLLLHVADRLDSTRQSRAFAQKLRQSGVPADVVPGANKTHTSINRDLGLPDDPPTAALFAFLRRTLEQRRANPSRTTPE